LTKLNYFRCMSVNSLKYSIVIPVIVQLVFCSGCNTKDESSNDWKNCYECTTSSWIGKFSGTGNYTKLSDHTSVEGRPVSIEIEETSPDYLFVNFNSPNYISAAIYGSLESNYIISFAGSGSSITASLDIRDQDLKLSGTVKTFHTQADSIVTDELINFETYKE
jgi:hypothetical protein